MACEILRLSPFMGISTHSTFWERKVLNHEWENNNREYSEKINFDEKIKSHIKVMMDFTEIFNISLD